MTRFVVCGETLIDLVPSGSAEGDTFRSDWQALSAGGPMNTAVALSQLGAETHFLGRLSTDSFGGQLRGHLTGAGVDLDLAVESSQATSIAVVSLDSAGRATYTFHFHDTANFGWQADELPQLAAADWLHIASLSCVVSPGAEVLAEWLAGVTAGVSYDVNVRPTVISDPAVYWAKVEPWLRLVGDRRGLVKASDEDIEFLARGAGQDGDPVEVATGWVADYGLAAAVVTRGPDGGVAVEPGGAVTEVPGYRTEVVDTVGAGDTFMAGFLDAHLRAKQDLTTCLQRAAAAAALVCARQGAQPPTAEEVDAFLADQG